MRAITRLVVLAVLVIGVLAIPGAVGRGGAADAGAGSATASAVPDVPLFCMEDNFNRIFKLNRAFGLVIGQLWATPVNGFVFGTLLPQQTGGDKILIGFFDPTVFLFWTCQGIGVSTGYYSGTCKTGQQVLPWASFKLSCPF